MTSEKKPKMARETTAEQLIPEENYEGIVNVITTEYPNLSERYQLVAR